MTKNLDNKSSKYSDTTELIKKIKELSDELDQKHYMERKIRFLLDIRGYLYINQLSGNYIEFGSFKSEMQFAAYHIIDGTKMIQHYVGLDTFEGEPDMSDFESDVMPVTKPGQFDVDFEKVKGFVSDSMHGKGVLVKGDFRKQDVLQECNAYAPFNVAIVDCNLLSSLESAINYSIENMINGGVVFIDDFLANFGSGKPLVHNMIEQCSSRLNRKLLDHNFYPPFAKSFIVS